MHDPEWKENLFIYINWWFSYFDVGIDDVEQNLAF